MTRDETTPVFRAPMRARDADLPAGPGADFCLRHGFVGIGPGSGHRRDQLIHRFATVEDGVFVWTRDSAGTYRLGRITGSMREDTSAEAVAVGITHVRDADWLDDAVPQSEVPEAVLATFARGGRNFQRTRDTAAERRTAQLWQRAQG